MTQHVETRDERKEKGSEEQRGTKTSTGRRRGGQTQNSGSIVPQERGRLEKPLLEASLLGGHKQHHHWRSFWAQSLLLLERSSMLFHRSYFMVAQEASSGLDELLEVCMVRYVFHRKHRRTQKELM